LRFVDLKKG